MYRNDTVYIYTSSHAGTVMQESSLNCVESCRILQKSCYPQNLMDLKKKSCFFLCRKFKPVGEQEGNFVCNVSRSKTTC